MGRAIRGEAVQACAAHHRRRLMTLALVVALLALAGGGAWLGSRGGGGSVAASPTPPGTQALVSEPWAASAERALAAGRAREALAALEAAPGGDPRANTLRARAWLRLERGADALRLIKGLPPGLPRSILALRAMASGGETAEGERLVDEHPGSLADPNVLRWRLLELVARPASIRELDRALRRARRHFSGASGDELQ